MVHRFARCSLSANLSPLAFRWRLLDLVVACIVPTAPRLRVINEHLDEHLHLETKMLKNINEHVVVSSIILLYLHTPVLNTV